MDSARPVILIVYTDEDSLLNVRRELEDIEAMMRKRDDYQVVVVRLSSVERLFNVLGEYAQRIAVFHFAGHADEKSLRLDDASANITGIWERLSTLPNLKLIFLNACSTAKQVARFLINHTGKSVAIIATAAPVNDRLAHVFAEEFYRGLCGHVGQRELELGMSFQNALALLKSKNIVPNDFRGISPVRGSVDLEQEVSWQLFFREGVDNILDWRLNKKNPPFWEKTKFWAFALALTGLFILCLLLFRTGGSERAKISIDNTFGDLPAIKNPCLFPAKFDSTHLYVLITRFEDRANSNETSCYGKSIEGRIDIVKNRDNISVKTCYVDGFSPNTSDEAALLRDSCHADIVIWGKLRNAGANCEADGICMNFQPSDTLIHYAGGKVPQKIDNDFQANASAVQLEDGLIKMGQENFDAWVMGMSNVKIGRKKPDFYKISPDLPLAKQLEAYCERAELFLSLHYYTKAIRDLDKAIEIKPDLAELYFSRGNIKEDIRKEREAIVDLDKAIQLKPDFSYAYNARGVCNIKIGLLAKAMEDFNKAIKIAKNNEYFYLNRSHVHEQLQNINAALTDLDSAIAINPQFGMAYYDRGRLRENIGKADLAKNDLIKSIKLNPNHKEAYIPLAISCRKLGELQLAINCYNKFIRLAPKDSSVYRNRAIVFSEVKNYAGALADIERAIKFAPNDPLVYMTKASIHQESGLLQAALQDFDKVIELNPNIKEAWLNRAALKSIMKQFSSAIADYSQAIALDSNYVAAYTGRGGVKEDLNQLPSSMLDLTKAIKLDPKQIQAYVGRAIVKRKLGLINEAMKDYEEALKINPNDADLLNNLGVIKHAVKQYHSALFYYKKAVALRPNEKLYYMNRSDTYRKLGRPLLAFGDDCQVFRIKHLPGKQVYGALLVLLGFITSAIWYWKRKKQPKPKLPKVQLSLSGKGVKSQKKDT